MSLWERLERALEGMVEGLFRKGFKGRVQPIEIARRLVRAMEDNRRVSVSRVYVPNEYIVSLHPEDRENLIAFERTLADELISYLSEASRRQRLYFISPPRVEFAADQTVPEAGVIVTARFVEPARSTDEEHLIPTTLEPAASLILDGGQTGTGVPVQAPQEQPSPTDPAHTVLNWRLPDPPEERPDNGAEGPRSEPKAFLDVIEGARRGERFLLGRGITHLGRKAENEVTLPDPNVSRYHAKVEYRDGIYVMIDMDSTNGTYVNGERIREKELSPGDHIRVGTTTLQFSLEPGEGETH